MINTIQTNPTNGTIGTITSFIFGMLPTITPDMQCIIIFWFQVLAFSVSIICGILTIVGYFKKHNKNDR